MGQLFDPTAATAAAAHNRLLEYDKYNRMTPDHIQFLNDNRTHYDTLINAGYLRGLSGETRQKMQDIIRANWEPGYHTDLWCGPCISDMVKKLYRLYDEWIKNNPDEKGKELIA